MEKTPADKPGRYEYLKTAALSAGAALFALALPCLLFGAFYEINDDVLMKDIVSGAYTGTPDGHNIQMLYPLSLLLSLPYRVLRKTDWYSLFFFAVHALCFFLIAWRMLRVQGPKPVRVITTVWMLLLYLLLFRHLVIVQYTFTAGLVSGTAGFLLLTGKGKKNGAAVAALLTLSYMIRSELLLLTLPMILVALLFAWHREEWERGAPPKPLIQRLKAAPFRSYLALALVSAAALLVTTMLHRAGYGSGDWRDFIRFFDARTQVYDFYGVPDYETHTAFYEAQGLTRADWQLLDNFNFGLSEEIDTERMEALAAYAATLPRDGVSAANTLKTYMRHLLDFRIGEEGVTDAPWNLAAVLLYAFVFFVLRGRRAIWQPGLLFACRTTLWLYLIWRGRVEVRVTHALYITELLILTGLLLPVLFGVFPREHVNVLRISAVHLCTVLMLLVIAIYAVPMMRYTKWSADNRRDQTEQDRILDDYTLAHGDCFYLVDTFTWVMRTDRLPDGHVHTGARFDLAGGWAAKSPLAAARINASGYDTMEEALLGEKVFFVQNTKRDIAWLSDYYASRGITVRVTAQDRIGTEEEMTVYRVEEVQR